MSMHMESPMLEAGEAIAGQSRLHTGFLVSAARYPDRVALSIGQQQWTYVQTDLRTWLRRWGGPADCRDGRLTSKDRSALATRA